MRLLLIIILLISLVTSPLLIAMSLPCCDHEMDSKMQHHVMESIDVNKAATDHSCCDEPDDCQCQLSNISYPPVAFVPYRIIALPIVTPSFLASLPLPFVSPDRIDRPPITS